MKKESSKALEKNVRFAGPAPVLRRCRPRAGFTLIEMMLVVIIISILAAMLIPRLAGRAEKARRSVAKAEIESNIPTALDLYEMDVGEYPEALEQLLSAPADVDTWDGPYLKKLPKDPWGNAYHYKSPGDHAFDYDLASMGRDGALGTDDDVANWEEE